MLKGERSGVETVGATRRFVTRPAGAEPGPEEMENAAAVNDGHRLSGLKVLVIDDSKTIRRTAETLLAKEGCEVFTAVDGFDALSKIADHQPDIVFVDIMMPRLDGYQTCSLIKHNKVFRSTPVIMLSSRTASSTAPAAASSAPSTT